MKICLLGLVIAAPRPSDEYDSTIAASGRLALPRLAWRAAPTTRRATLAVTNNSDISIGGLASYVSHERPSAYKDRMTACYRRQWPRRITRIRCYTISLFRTIFALSRMHALADEAARAEYEFRAYYSDFTSAASSCSVASMKHGRYDQLYARRCHGRIRLLTSGIGVRYSKSAHADYILSRLLKAPLLFCIREFPICRYHL